MSQTHRNMGYGLEIEAYSAGDEFPQYEFPQFPQYVRRQSRVHKKLDSIKLISDIDDSGEWISQQQGGQQGQQQGGQQGQKEWRQDAFLRISSIFALLKPEQQGQQEGQQEGQQGQQRQEGQEEYVSSRKRVVGSGQRQRQRPRANAYVSDTDSDSDDTDSIERRT